MRRRLVTALLALVALPAAATPARSPVQPPHAPRRIVSLNLCADQLLLALADRAQIAGLSANAADPVLSAGAAQTRGLRILGQSAEEVLAIAPDLVIGLPPSQAGALGLLARRHYPTLAFTDAANYAGIVANVRTMARAVGHPERGEVLVARMNADLARVPRPGAGRIAAYYQRRGYVTGTGTLVDELMRRVGLNNLARRLDRPVLAQLSLEELVAARPDYLIVESASATVTDQGTEMLQHPALAHIPRLGVPQAWTVCGSPAYVRAAASLARQLR